MPDLKTLAAFARSRWAPEAGDTDSTIRGVAQTGQVIAVVTIGVIALIGTLIVSQVNSALPAISNSDLSSAQTGILDGVAGAMDLVPVVLIVIIASLVITIVDRLRGSGGGV